MSFAFIVIFVFCLAISGAGILISRELINSYGQSFHRNYLYYLMSFFSFALYAIWGSLLIRKLLSSVTDRIEVIEMSANFAIIFSLPFLLITWVMLSKMAFSMFGKKDGAGWLAYHFGLIVLFVLAVSLGQRPTAFSGHLPHTVVRNALIVSAGIFTLIHHIVFYSVIRILAKKLCPRGSRNIKIFGTLTAVSSIIQFAAIGISFFNQWTLGLAIVLLFASQMLPLLYLRASSDEIWLPIRAKKSDKEFISLVCRNYKVTKREQEIITQICEGKTNKEISEALFISLQTVKDHTHRIYTKVGIKNRMQLVKLISSQP